MFVEHNFVGPAADSALSLGMMTAIIVISALLGIAWAVINFLSIRTIDLTYPAIQPIGLTDNQHYHLVDIGDKIATVGCFNHVGSYRVFDTGISHLSRLRRPHVLHHFPWYRTRKNSLHSLRIPDRSLNIYGLWRHWNDDCNLHQLSSNVLCEEWSVLGI